MKNSTQHLIFVQVVIVALMLAGCSNVHTAKEPTVRSAVAGVISASEMSGDDDIDKEPSLVLTGNPNINSSVVRSPSSRALHRPVEEPAVQRIQGHALQATDTLDIKTAHEPSSNERVIKKYEKSNRATQSYHTVLVGDALKDVLGSRYVTGEPTVRDAVVEIIPAVEISSDDHITDELQEK
ncbi:MAG: hypothetical protein JXM79_18065 [Sedimentisphaerales bacterium]|nr:hypothetical protein [Sedimentisphaerales bacterium]